MSEIDKTLDQMIQAAPDDQRELLRIDDDLIEEVRRRRLRKAMLEDYHAFSAPIIGPYRLRPLRWFLTAAIEWKPQDLWIGAFWKRTAFRDGFHGIDVWVCVVPCFPIHLWWYRKDKEQSR